MGLFGNFFKNRKLKKKEAYADHQYHDALEIIKESMDTYLDLWSRACEEDRMDDADRLEAKLNSDFEHFNKTWDGSVKIVHTVKSTSFVNKEKKRLRLD